jgi:hypothetical protein
MWFEVEFPPFFHLSVLPSVILRHHIFSKQKCTETVFDNEPFQSERLFAGLAAFGGTAGGDLGLDFRLQTSWIASAIDNTALCRNGVLEGVD